MAKNTYELTYIVNGVLNDNQIRDVVQRVRRFIEEHGGEIVHADEWGTRRLAYPIKKKRNGYYVNMYIRAEGELITRLERALEIADEVLRYLTLKLDAKMLRFFEAEQAGELKRRTEEKAARAARSDDDDEDDD